MQMYKRDKFCAIPVCNQTVAEAHGYGGGPVRFIRFTVSQISSNKAAAVVGQGIAAFMDGVSRDRQVARPRADEMH